MGQHITLALAPWETARPKPPIKKRYPRRAFPKGTPQVEKYWRKGHLTDRQYSAAATLMKANTVTKYGYSSMQFKPRVDGGKSFSTEDKMDGQLRVQALLRAIPPEYFLYVLRVVIDDKSLWTIAGCSGGVNLKRYYKRLGLGLDALSLYLKREALD